MLGYVRPETGRQNELCDREYHTEDSRTPVHTDLVYVHVSIPAKQLPTQAALRSKLINEASHCHAHMVLL